MHVHEHINQRKNHPLNLLNKTNPKSRYIRQTIFENKNYTTNLDSELYPATVDSHENNKKVIYNKIVNEYIQNKDTNKLIKQQAPDISQEEQNLPCETRRILAQLRINKSPILHYYLNKIDPINHTSALCTLCKSAIHDTFHLFNCPRLTCSKTVISLWNDPVYAASLLARWRLMGGLP